MNITRIVSLLLRVGAVSGALVGLVWQSPPARSAVPAVLQAAPAIPVPNMMAYWALDSATGGITADGSGNANNGTLTGAAAISTANKAAVPAGNPASLAISGTANDIVTVPDSASLSITGSFTLAAWIRPTLAADPVNGTQHGIIEKWDWNGSAAVNGYMLRLDRENNLSFAVCGPTGNSGISTRPRAIPTNVWTHVAATYNSTSGAISTWVGGVEDFTTGTAPAAPGNGTAELHIGADYGANRFGGNIDEARIYNRQLNVTEIGILRDGQPAPTGLVATGGSSQNQLSWTAAAGAATYSVLRGTSTGTYDTVFNNISGTTYTDTTPTPGTPYFYVVVAVSVMASGYSNEQTATANNTPPPPPPPPPAPRTQEVGSENNPCGCGSASTASGWAGMAAVLALLGATLSGLLRRRSFRG